MKVIGSDERTAVNIVDGLPGEPGKDGLGNVVQQEEPIKKFEGMVWFQTNENNQVIAIKKYTDGAWLRQEFTDEVISAKSLAALSAILGDVTAGTIKSVLIENGNGTFKVDKDGNLTATSATLSGAFTNHFRQSYQGSTLEGTFKISGAETIINYTIVETGQVGFVNLSPFGLAAALRSSDGRVLWSWDLGLTGLRLKDEFGEGTINSTTFYETAWAYPTLETGVTHINDKDWFMYRNKYNDFQLRGGIRVTAKKNAYVKITRVPMEFRVANGRRLLIVMPGGAPAMCEIRENGDIYIMHDKPDGAYWFSFDNVSVPLK